MSNGALKSLNFLTLLEAPEPFFTEYATHYRVPVDDYFGERLDNITIAAKTLCAGGSRENPPTIPLLSCHSAKYINGVLHFRHNTAADYEDPEAFGAFPTERLPLPCDDYSDDERVPVQKRPKPRRVMMDFVFPPQGRRLTEPTKQALEREKAGLYKPLREPLPEDYLDVMLVDLERESKLAAKEYGDAEEALKTALYAHECLRLEVQEEQKAWQDFWGHLSGVVGRPLVKSLVARAEQRVKGEIPADEVERAIAEGDLPNPHKEVKWKSRVAVPSPVPRPPATRPPRTSMGTTLGGKVTSVHEGNSHKTPLPAFPPALAPSTTFGGTATAFNQGVFLKRRRDSDVASDSDADDSDGGPPSRAASSSSSRKRSRMVAGVPDAAFPPPGLVQKHRSTSPRPKTSERSSSLQKSTGRRSPGAPSPASRHQDLPPLPSPTTSESALLAASP
ncbi:hypothetical protein C8R44DRAFT_58444 [Mycena epipterygia]|nr:hypothetical protein C8R44DRAFT_58444 [Mycena epipterygia]